MTFEELQYKINNAGYKNTVEFPPIISRREAPEAYQRGREAWRNGEMQIKEEFKADCKKYIEGHLKTKLSDSQWEKVWGFAWEEGHSSGIHEVFRFLVDMEDVLGDFVGRPTRGR